MECKWGGTDLFALATCQVNTGGNCHWLVAFVVTVFNDDYLVVLFPSHDGRDVQFKLEKDEKNAANEANGYNLRG